MQIDRFVKEGHGWARKANLHYVSDRQPGITRARSGNKFHYTGPDGKKITNDAVLKRIQSLVIPPAWTEVWICKDADGHIQATGRDARGRKQYRYHARWRETRDENKFGRMLSFGRALPKIRAAVGRQMRQPGLDREKVLAAVVRLLELSAARVGNEEYAIQNHSYGLTTLRTRHASVRGATVHLHFRGKSGKEQKIDVEHPVLARIVRKCQHLPGQMLFQFIEGNKVHHITSSDVNEYLAEISGEQFTAKDFRTWTGTLLAATFLKRSSEEKTQTKIRHIVVEAIKHVALHLGNTPAICRKCYIHPSVIQCYMEGTLTTHFAAPVSVPNGRFRQEEFSLLSFLQRLAKTRPQNLLGH